MGRLVVVGAGGNIGSHLMPHLARMDGVREIVAIDRGVYESSHTATQAITPREVGHPKAAVQARRLREINSALVVRPIAQPVEAVPLGYLRGDLLLACLDSRAARQFVNQAAWQLGIPWLDAGVHADGLLARVSAYLPGPGTPCLECAWDQRDYDALEQAYPCAGHDDEPPATGAPSSLGALAAALQALECRKLLAGARDRVAFGCQMLIDASSHRHYVTSLRRHAACRMPEHLPWQIRSFDPPFDTATLETAFGLVPAASNGDARWTLSAAGRTFVTGLTCPRCGTVRRRLRLQGVRGVARDRCRACGAAMVAAGFDLRDRLTYGELSRTDRRRLLRTIGLRRGDVLTVEGDGDRRHYLIDGVPRPL